MNSYAYSVGVASADISPPLDVGILMSSVEQRWAPFEDIRQRLMARVLVVQFGSRRLILVALDLLGLADAAVGGWQQFKSRVAAATVGKVRPEEIVFTSTHTHSGPETLALTPLYQTEQYQNWLDQVIRRVAEAISHAGRELSPARLAYGNARAPGLAIYRRIKTTQGILLSHPPPPPEIVISREGPVDDQVQVAAFINEREENLCTIVNAACHPVHEMCFPVVSGDYPGVLCSALEARDTRMCLFLNGGAGNLNPPTVSGGPKAADEHGARLAAIVQQTLSALEPSSKAPSVQLAWGTVNLPAAEGFHTSDKLTTALAAARVGELAFVFVPGEPFVETSLAIQAQSPFQKTFFAGYAEEWIGYIPTDQAFEEGGYEAGPGLWSRLRPPAEGLVRSECLALLNKLNNRDA